MGACASRMNHESRINRCYYDTSVQEGHGHGHGGENTEDDCSGGLVSRVDLSRHGNDADTSSITSLDFTPASIDDRTMLVGFSSGEGTICIYINWVSSENDPSYY